MSTYSLKTIQNIPLDIDTAWDCFRNPANLQNITPPEMDFKIISLNHGGKMYPGQIIEYKVKPIPGISIYWMTEITHVEDKKYFVDEQRFGPYQLWHHQHHFRQIDGGVEMTDIVHYRNPLGILGNIANSIFVEKQLSQIFKYRFQKVEELFGKWHTPQNRSVHFDKAV
ncbi:MAG: SRPBCC family protein [Ferruginibacter sp.]